MLKIVGMQELSDKLHKIGNANTKVGNVALKKAALGVKKTEVDIAKKLHHTYSEDIGWKELKIHGVKMKRTGSKYIDTGMRVKGGTKKNGTGARSSHWDKTRGLWFNNFGFYHNRTGQYVAGSNWLSKAYDESADDAFLTIYNTLLEEMGFK